MTDMTYDDPFRQRVRDEAANVALPYAHPGSWSLHPESCRWVLAFVRIRRPRSLLEFGSGFSTRLIARELAASGGTLTSVDNAPEWSAQAEAAVKNDGHGAPVRFAVAPLASIVHGCLPYVGFDRRAAALERGGYDFILVDAPHQDVGRDGALAQAAECLAPGGVVVCDDANTEHLRRTASRFLRRHPTGWGAQLEKNVGGGLLILWKTPGGAQRTVLPPLLACEECLRFVRNRWRAARLRTQIKDREE